MAEEEKAALNEAARPDPKIEAEVERQVEALRWGTVELIGEDDLRRKLRRSVTTGVPLRVKLGVDPTAHDLHVGFTVPLTKLRIFQDLGHLPVLIIGDATAMVGDPTGKNKARPQLTREMVDDYARSYLEQAALVLDLERCELRRNSEWLHALGFTGLIELVAKATVAQMLVRDDFAKRYAEGTAIYLHELVYPLMQGHDSVVVRADVELGGQDQLFNLLIGRQLQREAGQEEQVCMMGPLLVGLDGKKKMSKSAGNYVGISEPAGEMFGKIMSIPDEAMLDWFVLAARMPKAEAEALIAAGGHPRELKDQLARLVVARFHDGRAAEEASATFRRVISNKETPEEMPELRLAATELAEGGISAIRLVVLAGYAASNGEARRLVQQGGVRLDGEPVTDPTAALTLAGGEVLKVGKRNFARILLD
ncbi:MAG: tyrosine--tRNA ligase [Planctomycetes bacterium]|nr:tyrosine--tRNA ligase [Planctomycetota bacterium]